MGWPVVVGLRASALGGGGAQEAVGTVQDAVRAAEPDEGGRERRAAPGGGQLASGAFADAVREAARAGEGAGVHHELGDAREHEAAGARVVAGGRGQCDGGREGPAVGDDGAEGGIGEAEDFPLGDAEGFAALAARAMARRRSCGAS